MVEISTVAVEEKEIHVGYILRLAHSKSIFTSCLQKPVLKCLVTSTMSTSMTRIPLLPHRCHADTLSEYTPTAPPHGNDIEGISTADMTPLVWHDSTMCPCHYPTWPPTFMDASSTYDLPQTFRGSVQWESRKKKSRQDMFSNSPVWSQYSLPAYRNLYWNTQWHWRCASHHSHAATTACCTTWSTMRQEWPLMQPCNAVDDDAHRLLFLPLHDDDDTCPTTWFTVQPGMLTDRYLPVKHHASPM